MSASNVVPVEVIQQNVSYPLPVFSRVTGLGKHALRAARRAGLRVLYIGNRAFVNGSDWLRFVEENGADGHRGAVA